MLSTQCPLKLGLFHKMSPSPPTTILDDPGIDESLDKGDVVYAEVLVGPMGGVDARVVRVYELDARDIDFEQMLLPSLLLFVKLLA